MSAPIARPGSRPAVPDVQLASPSPLSSWSARKGWGVGVAGLLLLIAAFPPWDLWPLALVAPWLLALCAQSAPTGRAAFGRLTVLGVGLMFGGTYWIQETLFLGLIIIGLVEGPIIGCFGWMVWRLRGASLFPALPVLWVAHEMVRLNWPETGYSWLFVGHALAASPLLVQIADVGGVLAVSFVGVSAATAVGARLTRQRGALPAALVVVVGVLYGVVRPMTLADPEPGPWVSTLQPGIAQELKDNITRADDLWESLFAQAQALAAGSRDPRLLVLPETMWPWPVLADRRPDGAERSPDDPISRLVARDRAGNDQFVQQVLALFDSGSTRLLLGALAFGLETREHLRDPRTGRQLNAALYLDEQGQHLGRYDKHILIPGGEMLPFKAIMPEAFNDWLDRTVREMAGFVPDLTAGEGPVLFELDGVPFGVTICFENCYGDYNRRFVAQGARFLVNLSNEGWFGTSPEFDHMELHSVLRATATRRAIFRSTNTGVSCLVRPDGQAPRGLDRLLVEGVDRGVAGTFTARVPLHRDRTFYVLAGDWLGWACLAGALVLLVGRARRPLIP